MALTEAATAQSAPAPQVLVVDTDRLFSESTLGRARAAEFEQAFRALAAENAEIEATLISDERALTDLRPSLSPEEFRARADAFDKRVDQLRAEQDEKERQLSRARDEAQAELFNAFSEIVSEIVRTRGALVVIDRRNVYLSVGGLDITDEALAQFNALRDLEEN